MVALALLLLGTSGPQIGHSDQVPLEGTLLVVNQASDTVTLVDLANMEAFRHVPVVGGPHEVAVSADGARAVVTNYYQRGRRP
jgi:YVTN family beta-propeller protein